RSVFIPIPKKGNTKECSNYRTIALISHTSKVMLKILQARLQQYVNCELPDVQTGFEKAEEPEIKLPTSAGSWKKQESSRKTSFCFINYAKAFDCVDHKKLWRILRDENTRPPYLPLEKPVHRSGSNS
ncbi:reverse transcriptase domain-containing protein, partial [Pseudomonas aeruginosa]|uniref:reverse transcriptase domain-containing protein n=1 Tax=Pseudomonas aeruginosa TaxID=287 RepID=UPI003CF39434